MAVIASTPSETRGKTSEPNSPRGVDSNRDKNQDWDSSIIPGSLGLLILLLLVAVSCALWSRNKRKRRQVPYYRVTTAPLTNLPPPRPRAKNIYEFLPRRQEEQGRPQSRSIRVFSTESLLSRNSDGLPSEQMVSYSNSALQEHRDGTRVLSYSVGIYDNSTESQICGNLSDSAHYINVRASRECSSTSSEDSRDYINVPATEVTAEISTSSPLEDIFVLSNAQELELTEEKDQEDENTEDCARYWSPETEGSDALSDGESSSQTSNDYVNMSGLDLGVTQEEQPKETSEHCGDYENILPENLKGKQQQGEEKMALSNTDLAESRTSNSETHVQLITQSGTSLDVEDYVSYQPAAQNESQQICHGEETSLEDCNDYENVLVVKLGNTDSERAGHSTLS